jgi:ubiquinone/menaquinone biosynthesis C-methylase UbiE
MLLNDDVKEKFGSISKKYDSQRKYLIPCFDDFYQTCLPLIKSVPNAKTILDIGAGPGFFRSLFTNATRTCILLWPIFHRPCYR